MDQQASTATNPLSLRALAKPAFPMSRLCSTWWTNVQELHSLGIRFIAITQTKVGPRPHLRRDGGLQPGEPGAEQFDGFLKVGLDSRVPFAQRA
jgi:hypothetical protein